MSAPGSEREGAPDTSDAAGHVHLLRRLRARTDDVVRAPVRTLLTECRCIDVDAAIRVARPVERHVRHGRPRDALSGGCSAATR